MAKGSFTGLYTFDEIAKIYQKTNSNLRKMVQFGKFIEGTEIKKFGKTWLITEEAVRNHFGDNIDDYCRELKLAELEKLKEDKIHSTKKNNGPTELSCSDDFEQGSNLDYIEVDPSSVLQSFNFSNEN